MNIFGIISLYSPDTNQGETVSGYYNIQEMEMQHIMNKNSPTLNSYPKRSVLSTKQTENYGRHKGLFAP
jgi:hypothetical protein